MPMNSFDFVNPVRIVFGKGQIAKLATYIPEGKKVLVTYGGGSIKRNGVYDQVMTALKDHEVKEFGGIESNPDYDTLMKAVAILKEMGTEETVILSVGGGSVADGSKFIAAAAVYKHSENTWEILETGAKYVKESVPLYVVITLPATGSEMNNTAVISYRAKNLKLAFATDIVYPVVSILDPETTLSLPTNQTANGVVDSIVHVLEQYCTYPMDAEVQDRYAEGLLITLIESGKKVMENPKDLNARANIMWAATQALNKWIAQGVVEDWATHMIGHELTASIGLAHAETLPRVFAFNFESKKAKLAQMAERVFNVTEGDVDAKAKKCMELLFDFYENTMKVPTRISKYSCSQDKAWIDRVCERFTEQGVKLGELGNILPENVKQIILDSY
ncbi:hypothetical protein WA158_005524 [Blastocystis sp. Blastoise]